MTRLIALTGYAGSGKSTVAKHLVDHHGFTLVKFAGPLKSMMRCLGLGDREIEGDLKEEPHRVLNYKTPRYAMQTIGTEWGREIIGQNLWVDVAMASALAVLDQGGSVVIDDCRFQNEADEVKRLLGEVIQITRPCVGRVNEHVSENTPAGVTFHWLNDGTEDDLRQMATSYIISRSMT
jgi:energy-coupling factor transporter ATP-binding protein EcfA2